MLISSPILIVAILAFAAAIGFLIAAIINLCSERRISKKKDGEIEQLQANLASSQNELHAATLLYKAVVAERNRLGHTLDQLTSVVGKPAPINTVIKPGSVVECVEAYTLGNHKYAQLERSGNPLSDLVNVPLEHIEVIGATSSHMPIDPGFYRYEEMTRTSDGKKIYRLTKLANKELPPAIMRRLQNNQTVNRG